MDRVLTCLFMLIAFTVVPSIIILFAIYAVRILKLQSNYKKKIRNTAQKVTFAISGSTIGICIGHLWYINIGYLQIPVYFASSFIMGAFGIFMYYFLKRNK